MRQSAGLPALLCLALIVGAARGASAQAPADDPGVATGPPAPPAPAPATSTGSLTPDVYLEDLTYTLRLCYLRSLAVSPHDPKVAYLGSWHGNVFKTVDGGKTWDESRLIVQPFPFYGDSGQYLYFGRHRVGGSPAAGFDNPLNRKSGNTTKKSSRASTGADTTDTDSGVQGRAGAAGNVNFGVGLPGRAPRLQLVVRKWGKPTAGLNIKQTLLLRGSRPLEVRFVAVHPRDPKVVFACTAFGLYRTNDGGLNWMRVFLGTSPKGRMAFHIAFDPSDPRRVFLATGEGLYISEDGGDNFLKTTKKGVGEGVIDWVYFNPHDPRYVFVGTDYGLLRSPDGGENWQWIYFTTFPDARVVRQIQLDPFDRKTGYIATHDGLFYTDDLIHGGLESWKRLGGLKFSGVETSRIEVCPRHKGHMWTLTNMKLYKPTVRGKHDTGGAFLYESLDGGRTWKVIYSGNTYGSMQWFESDPTDPDLLWIVWSRSIVRMRRRPPDYRPDFSKTKVPDDPPIGQMLLAAYSFMGVEPGDQHAYRQRSMLKALVPRLDATYIHYRYNDYAKQLETTRYLNLPYQLYSSWFSRYQEFRFMLTWDLSDYIFNLNSTFFGRVDRISGEVRAWLLHEVQHFYGEFRRLRMLMANNPPEDLRVRLMYKLRLEELASYLNFLSGNYLRRWWRGQRSPGLDTRWWEPWKVPGSPTNRLYRISE